MYLRKLTLTNTRAFRTAEFDFLGEARVHLIVGVNGVGKSTVLETLRVLLSKLIPEIEKTGVQPDTFATKDKAFITEGEKFMATSLTGEVMDYPFFSIADHKAQASVQDNRPVERKVRASKSKRSSEKPDPNLRDSNREQTIETPDVADFFFQLPPTDKRAIALELASKSGIASAVSAPEKDVLLKEVQAKLAAAKQKVLAVYYSPHRSLITRKTAKIGRTQRAAYVEALDDERRFSIKDIADWWSIREQEAVDREDRSEITEIEALFKHVVSTFLDDCDNLQLAPANDDRDRQLLLTKNGHLLGVQQLSDGERSVLALTLDLARRLYLANPGLPNPASNGSAIVLIDELDLHLHPGWQRDVVQRLESTFPKCQFIASTHSVQIIGEVQPDRVTWLIAGRDPFKRAQSYGLEAGWIIEFLMGVPNRNVDVTEQLENANQSLAERDFSEAHRALDKARKLMHGPDGELTELEAATDSLEALYDIDAEDN